MTRAVLLGTLVLVVAVAAAGEASIYDFMLGEWDFTQYKTPIKTAEIPETLETVHYTFNKRNGSTTVLDGFYIQDDTRHLVQINFVDAFTGEYLVEVEGKTPKKEDEEVEGAEQVEFATLYKFSFVNVSAGHYVSQGVYGTHGAYQAIISTGSAPSFVFTILEADENGAATEYITVLAKKILPPRQPTFFQKYGLVLMMGVMLLTNFARGRQAEPNVRRARAAAEANRSGNAADTTAATTPAEAPAAPASESKKDQ